MLREVEEKKKQEIITPDTVAVGIARAGGNSPTLKADFVKDLVNYDFGEPPYQPDFSG